MNPGRDQRSKLSATQNECRQYLLSAEAPYPLREAVVNAKASRASRGFCWIGGRGSAKLDRTCPLYWSQAFSETEPLAIVIQITLIELPK